jgi:Predicted xylanase/chitin deacetylase
LAADADITKDTVEGNQNTYREASTTIADIDNQNDISTSNNNSEENNSNSEVSRMEVKNTEDNKAEDNKTEDNKTEDNKAEDNRVEDNKTEDNKTEDNKTIDVNSNIHKIGTNEIESTKIERTKAESMKTEDTKTEDTKTESSTVKSNKTESTKTESTKTNEKGNYSNNLKYTDKQSYNRRKRINRIKIIIIIIVIALLLLPTICCILLGLQVSSLQRQVNELTAIHGQYKVSAQNNHENYAYAAEKPDDITASTKITVSPVVSEEKKEDETVKSENASKDIQTGTIAGDKVATVSEASDTSSKPGIYEGKKIYLTFDDGPSIYTDTILDILADYNVKATFFVIGKTDEGSKASYKRIVKEGHTLGMHSYSHQYNKIYNSVEDFEKDFTKLWKLLYDTTGYKPSIYRFPGGSGNTVNPDGMDQFIDYLNKASIVYFDWNVVNGDATDIKYTRQQLINNVLNGVADKDRSIVLMHDTQAKKTTVDALGELIGDLQSQGAQLLALNKDVAPIQMIKADTVK